MCQVLVLKFVGAFETQTEGLCILRSFMDLISLEQNHQIGDLRTNSNFWIDRFPYWQLPFIQTLDTGRLLLVQLRLIKLGN
jgi:hypothetical protein